MATLCLAIPSQAGSYTLGSGANSEPPTGRNTVLLSAPSFTGGEAPARIFSKSAQIGTAQGFSIDTQDRELVRNFYNSVFQSPDGLASGWSSNQTAPGTLNAGYLEAIRQRVNWYRAMAGAPASVNFLSNYNSGCQQAALMMSRAGQLSHSPPTVSGGAWPYATPEGAVAALNSNLTLGACGFDSIVRYMQDSGADATNADTGHRRWLLHPSIQNMGAGSVDTHTVGSTTYMSAQALWVNDNNSYLTAWPAVRDHDPATSRGIVAWPPPGYVPHQQVFPRWSFSMDRLASNSTNVMDASTSVTMTKNGVSLAVGSITRPANMGRMMTIVFTPAGYATDSEFEYSRPASDDVYVVNITGILMSNVRGNVSYTVRIFDPAKPAAGVNPITTTGTATPVIGQANAYTHTTANFATSYRLFTGQAAAYSAVEGAETGLTDFIAFTAGGYAQRLSTTKDTGSFGFRLAHPTALREVLQWNKMFVPAAGATLTVRSYLRRATATEVARVQISTNGGVGWSDLLDTGNTFPNYGVANGDAESGFSTATFSLTQYVGRAVMFRFAYEVVGYGAYYQPLVSLPEAGWFFDNITLTGSQVLSNTTSAVIPEAAGLMNYVPADGTPRLLAVQPIGWTDYNAEIGSLLTVTGITPPPKVWMTDTQVAGGNLNLNFTVSNLPASPVWKLMSTPSLDTAYQQYNGSTFQTVSAPNGQYRYVIPLPAESTRFFYVEVK